MGQSAQAELIARVMKVIAAEPAKGGWAAVRAVVRQKLGEQDLKHFESLTLLEICSGMTIADLIGIADQI